MIFFNKIHQECFEMIINFIINAYNQNLISLAVYGSYASSTQKINSDIDLLIILDKKKEKKYEWDFFYDNIELKINPFSQNLFNNYKISMDISPYIISKEQAVFFQPIYLDMTENISILFDKDEFLQNILNKLNKIKKEFHYKKIPYANKFIWDMSSRPLIQKRL
jgi:predicted nucleotidyltransferase